MSRYRVIFFKNLLGIDGHAHKCLQQSIVISRAKSVERAVEAAFATPPRIGTSST